MSIDKSNDNIVATPVFGPGSKQQQAIADNIYYVTVYYHGFQGYPSVETLSCMGVWIPPKRPFRPLAIAFLMERFSDAVSTFIETELTQERLEQLTRDLFTNDLPWVRNIDPLKGTGYSVCIERIPGASQDIPGQSIPKEESTDD